MLRRSKGIPITLFVPFYIKVWRSHRRYKWFHSSNRFTGHWIQKIGPYRVNLAIAQGQATNAQSVPSVRFKCKALWKNHYVTETQPYCKELSINRARETWLIKSEYIHYEVIYMTSQVCKVKCGGVIGGAGASTGVHCPVCGPAVRQRTVHWSLSGHLQSTHNC